MVSGSLCSHEADWDQPRSPRYQFDHAPVCAAQTCPPTAPVQRGAAGKVTVSAVLIDFCGVFRRAGWCPFTLMAPIGTNPSHHDISSTPPCCVQPQTCPLAAFEEPLRSICTLFSLFEGFEGFLHIHLRQPLKGLDKKRYREASGKRDFENFRGVFFDCSDFATQKPRDDQRLAPGVPGSCRRATASL